MLSVSEEDPKAALQFALTLAEKSPPKPTNFRVGALIARLDNGSISATGYTLELPGNTHAEECCLLKLAEQHGTTEEQLSAVMAGQPHVLFTTVEPCFKRLSGKLPCVERVLRQRDWIKKVYVGVQEPETFVGENTGRAMLEEAGIEVCRIEGLESDILQVATAGHEGK